jgi:hypothetical protein
MRRCFCLVLAIVILTPFVVCAQTSPAKPEVKLTRDVLLEHIKIIATVYDTDSVWQFTVISEARLLLENSKNPSSKHSKMLAEYDTAASLIVASVMLNMWEEEEVARFDKATQAIYGLVKDTPHLKAAEKRAQEDFILLFQIPEDSFPDKQTDNPDIMSS